MSRVVVVGLQWGDEGKGKIVDLLCPAFDLVVRYQGGHNAGHTVKFGDRHFSLRLIPSGILHPAAQCVLGNGMVIDPDAFLTEIGELAAAGIEVEGRLFLSDRAHVILPQLAELDRARERAAGEGKIGTTGRGIGPTYEMKAGRAGMRVADLCGGGRDGRLQAQLERVLPQLEALAAAAPAEAIDAARTAAARLRPFVRDTEALLHQALRDGRSILFEGAQGALLDVDHGTYPFVTSSNSTAGGACTGTGVPPTAIDGTIGILKAYATRVGAGPFPSELDDEVGEYLRKRGNEFGTVTGRPRRCGWLDLVAARYSCALNGVTAIALTKLDVLDTQAEIPVCVGYRVDGETIDTFPASIDALEAAEPVLRTFPGWQSSTVGCLAFENLPRAAQDYVRMIERELDAPISLVSTGPRREETIVSEDPVLERLTGGRLGEVLAGRDA
jgi:adenylosuccinate synthase